MERWWPRRRLPAVQAALLVALTAVLGVIAYWLLFSNFNVPDDVGYVLMSIRKFFQGEALYSEVYSQYGPGVFVLVGGFNELFGVSLGLDAAGFWNLFMWLSSSLFLGLALLRLTGRLSIAAIGLLLAFLILRVDANEPLHPGATICFLLCGMVLAAACLPLRARTAMAALGLLGAAVVSLKVNVGLFALLAVVFAGLSAMAALRRREVARVLATLAFVAVPFPLLAENLNEGWAQRYAIIVSCSALGLALVGLRLRPAAKPDLAGAKAFGAGVAAMIALVAIGPILNGTSPGDLIDGWVIRPPGTAELANAPLLINSLGTVFALLGVAAAGTVVWSWDRWTESETLAVACGLARLAAGLAIWISLSGPVFDLPIDLTQGLVIGAPLLWSAAIPVAGAEQNSFVRMVIPSLAVLQLLHAYPMPGSQLAWSVLLLVPVGGLLIGDGLTQLATVQLQRRWGPVALRLLPTLAVLGFGAYLCLKPLREEAKYAHARYEQGVPLELAGATSMRLDPALAGQLQDLNRAIAAECDSLLTLPGMNSLNFLSGVEAPVELSSPWPFFFTVAEQRRIVGRIEAIDGLCVVHKPDLVQFWGGFFGGAPPRRPLIDYMEQNFTPVRDFSGYVLRTR